MTMRLSRKMGFVVQFKWFFITTVAVSSWLSTGCYDRQELEQQAFVSVLGIDKAPGGLLDCTFIIAVPTNPAGGGSSKPPLAASTPITYRAHDITEALVLANSSVERTLTMSHLTSIVFGTSVAREGLRPYLDTLARYREFRRTVYVAVGEETAKEVLTANEPMLEQTTVRQADGVARVAERNGVVVVTQLHRFLTAQEDNHVDPVLPLYAVNQQVKDDPKGEAGISGKEPSFTAGKVQRSGGNPVEWTGAALFRGDKLAGVLDGQETMQLRILQGDVHSTKLDFPNLMPGFGTLGLSIKKERSPRYRVTLAKPLTILVEVPLEADVIAGGIGKDLTDTATQVKLEQQIDRRLAADFSALLDKTCHQFNVDVIPFSRVVRPQFATHREFARYPWESSLKEAKISVKVDLHLRRFGIQTLPASPQRS